MPLDNPQIKWRLELARELCAAGKNFPGLLAMAIGGSVAQGHADEYSDLELSVYWDEVPSVGSREQWYKDIGLTPVETVESQPLKLIGDMAFYRGFQVDFWHGSLKTTQNLLDQILDNFNHLMFYGNLRVCIPLLNEPQLDAWKNRVKEYSPELATKVIAENVKFLGYHNFETHLARSETSIVFGLLSGIQKRIFNILLALNQEYFCSYKRMDQVAQKFAIRPKSWKDPNLLFAKPLDQAVRETEIMMEETLLLVAEHYPQIEIKKFLHELKTPVRKPFGEKPL